MTELTALITAAAEAKPAGGAETTEVVLATAGAMVATVALVALGWAHRTGRSGLLRWAAQESERQSGIPAWAALPTLVATLSLLCALFGMYWDISLHIDDGRDAGPLANPAHYFILVGLFGVFAAGFLATVLPEGRPSPSAVRIAGDWYAPMGGLLLLVTGGFALIGFPLDDFWHRLFGQDVTLWGPTHLMLIGGAGLSLLGHAALQVEAGRAKPHTARGPLALIVRTRYAGVFGGLLIGLCTFQAEFDFGVPQFQLIFQPMLIAVAAAIALTAARIYGGRGAALIAVVYFLVIRGVVSLLVGPVLGETTPHFPLFVAEALLVELAALRLSTERPYRFGAVSGLLVGTLGTAAEWGWSHVWMPNPWPESLLGEVVWVAPLAGLAGGLIGGFVGAALAVPVRRAPHVPGLAPAAGALVAIAALIGYGLNTKTAQGVRAAVTLTDVRPAPERQVQAAVRLEPPSAADDARWVQVIAWQGGAPLHLEQLERTGPGTYRTTEPVPVSGTWKALVRVHTPDSVAGVPVFLPADPAIPAPQVPARPRFERPVVADHEILQRERKDGVAGGLTTAAYGVVGAITLALIAVLGWALQRIARLAGGAPPPRRRERRGRAPAPGALAPGGSS